MKVLVLNAGSSSLKYQVIDMENEGMLGKGIIERIGQKGSNLCQSKEEGKLEIKKDLKNHKEAFALLISALTDKENGLISNISDIGAIGHRVLHSAEDFNSSVIVDKRVMDICKANSSLGPLHMPANLDCIEGCMELMPSIPNVAVFDTVFHSTMPDYAFMYAIKYEDYKEHKIRKYGFHGTSHKYVTGEALKYLGKEHSKIITCHLGNGSSMAAVVDGKCVDTTMGLTPLEGLVMGTRSGDIDAAVVGFLADKKRISEKDAITYLNKESGFKGIAGVSDFRDLEKLCSENDERARLAVDMFSYRLRKYIGSFTYAMGGLDMIVLTGGIGENSSFARKNFMRNLEPFGIEFDFEKNETAPKGIYQEMHKPTSKVKIVIIPTNEELVIARDAKELVENRA